MSRFKHLRKIVFFIIVLLVSPIFFHCGSSSSTQPPEDTSTKLTGKFSEPGVDVEGVSVALYALKMTGGHADAPLAQAFTDEDGRFSLVVPDTVDLTTGKYLVVAFGSELARNVDGAEDQDVDPITDAVSSYIDDLLALGADVNGLTTDVITSLLADASGCDVNETPANIRACFLAVESFGTSIANAFSSAPVIQTLSSAPFDELGGATFDDYEELTCNDPHAGTPTGFVFDMTDEGAVSDGNNGSISDGCDDCGLLDILSGDTFSSGTDFPIRASGDRNEARIEDVDGDATLDQIVYLATTDGGLDVVRKVYVPQTFDCTLGGTISFTACGWARHLDCFANSTGSSVTLDININGDLGSDGEEVFVGSKSYEDYATAVYWSTKDEGGSDPQVGYVIDGPDGAVHVSQVSYGGEGVLHSWTDQIIADGERACFLYYFVLGDREDPEGDILGLMDYLFENSPRDGILAAEDRDIRNFAPKLFSMKGEAGSMPPNSQVTITNTTTFEDEIVTADEFGRFTSIVGCVAGETLEAVSSVGPVTISGTCN